MIRGVINNLDERVGQSVLSLRSSRERAGVTLKWSGTTVGDGFRPRSQHCSERVIPLRLESIAMIRKRLSGLFSHAWSTLGVRRKGICMAMSVVERVHEARQRVQRISDHVPALLPNLGAGNHPRYKSNALSKGALIVGGIVPEVVSSFRSMHCSGIGDAKTGHVPLNAQNDLHVRLHATDAISGRPPSMAG